MFAVNVTLNLPNVSFKFRMDAKEKNIVIHVTIIWSDVSANCASVWGERE